MFEDLKNFIKGKITLPIEEVDDTQFTNWEALELALDKMDELDLDYGLRYCVDEIRINFDLLTNEFKARLREMRLRMRKPLIALKRLKHSRIAIISLLFGLCSTESTLILDAYFGASLSRIPSL